MRSIWRWLNRSSDDSAIANCLDRAPEWSRSSNCRAPRPQLDSQSMPVKWSRGILNVSIPAFYIGRDADGFGWRATPGERVGRLLAEKLRTGICKKDVTARGLRDDLSVRAIRAGPRKSGQSPFAVSEGNQAPHGVPLALHHQIGCRCARTVRYNLMLAMCCSRLKSCPCSLRCRTSGRRQRAPSPSPRRGKL